MCMIPNFYSMYLHILVFLFSFYLLNKPLEKEKTKNHWSESLRIEVQMKDRKFRFIYT